MNEPTPQQATSVSDLSAIAGTLRDTLHYDTENLLSPDYFVDSVHLDDPEKEKANNVFVSFLQIALRSASNEKELQDSVFTALEKHGNIQIMKESKKATNGEAERQRQKDKENERKIKKFIDSCKNTATSYFTGRTATLATLAVRVCGTIDNLCSLDTKNILDIYAKHYMSSICQNSTKMKEAEPGLFVKTSSRPDIVALIDELKDMVFAEIKNDEIYNNEDAIEQEICYLMLLLYWWRVICGRDVEKVYGFTICGPRCKSNMTKKRSYLGTAGGEQKYHISLIEVSIPEKLGQLNKAKIWQKQYAVNDTKGLLDLYKFLSNNTLWNKVDTISELKPELKAWMTLPRGWSDEAKAATDKWELVSGGTAAVVVRCFGTQCLQSFVSNDLVDPSLKWSAENLKEWFNLDDSHDDLYVKVKTRATDKAWAQSPTALWEGVVMMSNTKGVEDTEIKRLCDEYLHTYPRSPIQGVTDDYYAVVMFDRGSRRLDHPDALESLSLKDFAMKLLRLWDDTVNFSILLRYWHGDVAAFNIVLEENESNDEVAKFVLIDWDESAKVPKARHIGQFDVGAELRHNEVLRKKDKRLYTDVQFALIFRQLKFTHYDCKGNWNVKTEESLKDFRNAIESNDSGKVEDEAKQFVENVITEMKTIISQDFDTSTLCTWATPSLAPIIGFTCD